MKNVDFLFVYEVRNREIDSICLLGAYLEFKGYTVGYVNSWDSLYNWHREYKAKVIVLSACYNDGTYKFFTSHAYSFDKAVNLQWEQVLVNNITHDTDKTSWEYSGIALKTRHICWGENNQEYMLKRYGIDKKYLKICGYLPLDFYRTELREATEKKEALFSRYGLDPHKTTLLFVSSFSGVGLPKSEEAIGTDEKKKTQRKIQTDSQREILDWLIKLISAHKDIQIVYRPHPSEAKNPLILQYEKEHSAFHVIAKESIRNWIQNCDILCNWQSTSMIEMYVSKKKTYLLRPVSIPFFLEMPIFVEGNFSAISTFEELNDAVFNNAEAYAFPIKEDDLLRFYSVTDEPVYKRVGELLIETLNDPDYHSIDLNKKKTLLRKSLSKAKRNCLYRIRTLKSQLSYHLLSSKEKKSNNKSARTKIIEENYIHFSYYRLKMKQNRITNKELRKKIETYKKAIMNSER